MSNTEENGRVSLDLPFDLFEKYSLLSVALASDPQELIEGVLYRFFDERMQAISLVAERYSSDGSGNSL